MSVSIFQSDGAALGWLRDAGMSVMGSVPFFRDRMTASMCGVATGVLATMALPD